MGGDGAGQRRGLDGRANHQPLAGLEVQANLDDQFGIAAEGAVEFRGHAGLLVGFVCCGSFGFCSGGAARRGRFAAG